MTKTTPHFLLGGSTDWRAAATDQLSITNNALMLQSLPGAIRPLVDDAGSFGGLQAAIGVALDTQDRIYILDGTACQIKRFDRCLQQFVTLPCIGRSGNNPRQFFNPRGLSISKCDDLFVADTGNCRVQIFSLGTLALREVLGPLQVQTSTTGVSVKPVESEVTPPQATDCPPQIAFPAGTWQPWDVAVSKSLRT